jgi:hypothetical protein
VTRVPNVRIEFVDKLWPDWVAARVSNRTIYIVRGERVTRTFIAHELCHVMQRHRLSWRFLGAYLLGWARAGFKYRDNYLEVEARLAEWNPFYLKWADDIIEEYHVDIE